MEMIEHQRSKKTFFFKFSFTRVVRKVLGLCRYLKNYFMLYNKRSISLKIRPSLKIYGKIGIKNTYTWRYWSPRQSMWRFSGHFECFLKPGDKKTIVQKLAIWLSNIATTCMMPRHHLYNMFTKFHGLSTVNNFAKANRSVCVDQNFGKKLDVAATDKAAHFYQTLLMPKLAQKSNHNFLQLVEQNPGYVRSLIFRFFETFLSGNR